MGTFVVMMLMAGIFGCVVVGGVWMLSKSNGGNNPVGFHLREFKEGFDEGLVTSTNTHTNAPVQHVESMPVQSLHATHAASGAASGSLQRPGKGMAVVLMGLALLYLVSPLDLIPDLVPGVCHVDDVGVFYLAIKNAFKAFG